MNFYLLNPSTNAVVAYAPTWEAAVGIAYLGDEHLDILELDGAELDAEDHDAADPFAPPF